MKLPTDIKLKVSKMVEKLGTAWNNIAEYDAKPSKKLDTQSRKVAEELLYLYFDLKILEAGGLKNIDGPSGLCIVQYQGQKIYIFGDVHLGPFAGPCEKDCVEIAKTIITRDLFHTQTINHETKWFFRTSGDDYSCYSLIQLLVSIFTKAENKKQYVDFYFETPFIKKDDHVRNKDNNFFKTTIDKIDAVFNNCLHVDKRHCPWYPFVRFHYTDPRGGPDRTKPTSPNLSVCFSAVVSLHIFDNQSLKVEDFVWFTQTMIIILENEPQLLDIMINSDDFSVDYVAKFRSILNNKLKIGPAHLSATVTQLINNCSELTHQFTKHRGTRTVSLLKEQLDNVSGPIMKKKIVDYFQNDWLQNAHQDALIVYNDILKWLTSLPPNIKLYPRDRVEFIDIFSLAGIPTQAIYMDLYIISRMLRTKWSKPHHDSQVKFVYVGIAHSKKYSEFFQSLGAKVTEYQNSKGTYNWENIGERNGEFKCIESPHRTIDEFL